MNSGKEECRKEDRRSRSRHLAEKTEKDTSKKKLFKDGNNDGREKQAGKSRKDRHAPFGREDKSSRSKRC